MQPWGVTGYMSAKPLYCVGEQDRPWKIAVSVKKHISPKRAFVLLNLLHEAHKKTTAGEKNIFRVPPEKTHINRQMLFTIWAAPSEKVSSNIR